MKVNRMKDSWNGKWKGAVKISGFVGGHNWFWHRL